MSTMISTIVCCAAVCIAQPGEPQYKGHDLAYWRSHVQPSFSTNDRLAAIKALHELGQKDDLFGEFHSKRLLVEEIVPSLISLLKDSDAEIRAGAATALRNLDRPATISAIPEMTRLLKDPENRVRDAAVMSFIFRGQYAEAVIPHMVELVKVDSSPLVRKNAALVLRTSGTAGIAALERLLNAPETTVRSAAVSAFEKCYPQTTVPVPAVSLSPRFIELLEDPDKEIQLSAALALMQYDPMPDDIVPILLKHQNAEVRARIVSALLDPSQGKQLPFVDGLSEALATVDLQVRRKHAREIEMLGTQAIPLLVKLLVDKDAEVRGLAASGLGRLGPSASEAAPALEKLLKDMAPVYGYGPGGSEGLVCHNAGAALSSILKNPKYMHGLPKRKADGK